VIVQLDVRICDPCGCISVWWRDMCLILGEWCACICIFLG